MPALRTVPCQAKKSLRVLSWIRGPSLGMSLRISNCLVTLNVLIEAENLSRLYFLYTLPRQCSETFLFKPKRVFS
jgi:hypothetical protein